MDIFYEIETLIRYGIRHNLITEDDKILITNQILEILDIDDFKIFTSEEIINIEENLKMIKYPTETLDKLIEWCIKNNRLENASTTYQDLLNSKIMGRIIPRSSEIIRNFYGIINFSIFYIDYR